MPTMIFPDTPIWGVLYDYIRGKKKYPKWHEAKKYFEAAGWSCNRIGLSYYLHRKGEFFTSKTFELTLDQLKKACVIAQEHDIREVQVELHDCALFAQPVQE